MTTAATLLAPRPSTPNIGANGAGMLVVIDSRVEAYPMLADGVLPGATVIILNPTSDGISQITSAIGQHPSPQSLHLICHGAPGRIHLGATQLNSDNLEDYRHQLQQWANSPHTPPDILLYGCNVGMGEIGTKFIQRLAEITGGNIAASAEQVGNVVKGGKWQLSCCVGQVGCGLAFLPEAMAAYPGVLVTFGTATNFTAGSSPVSVAVGNFNGDAFQDLAVADRDSNSVSVLLGNGNGTFGTATNFTTGTNPYSVAVGNFNGDAQPDLAVANVNSSSVSVLLGNSNGTFGTATNFTTGTNPRSVAVGDFNGDAQPDLAVANAGSSSVSVLLGNGNGTFGTATDFTAGSNPFSVAVGNFNGDALSDLAVANSSGTDVSVLLGNGNGTLGTATTFTAGSNPNSVAVGNFNGDALSDLAVANRYSNDVSVLLGNGNGTFGTATNFTAGSKPFSVAVGNFNGDSSPDLAVANFDGNDVSVLLGNGNGTFGTATNFTVGPNPFSVAVGNFNGDSSPDLAVANFGSNNVSVLLNTTAPQAVPEPALQWQTLLFIVVIGWMFVSVKKWKQSVLRQKLNLCFESAATASEAVEAEVRK